MTMSLGDRERNVLKLAEGLLKLHSEGSLDETTADAEFLFRFEVTWCRWVNRIRSMMRAMIGQTGEEPLSRQDRARWWVHLNRNAGLSVSIDSQDGPARWIIENPTGAYHVLDEDLRTARGALAVDLRAMHERPDEYTAKAAQIQQEMWFEANQTTKIQGELRRLARSYGLVPSDHQLGQYPLDQIKLQYDSVVNWVLRGESVPAFLHGKTRLIESAVQGEDRRSIRLWKWGASEPFSEERIALETRIRTWAVYYLTKRGGGELAPSSAAELWNAKFSGRRVELGNYEDDRGKLFDWGTGKGLSPSLAQSFDSVRNRWAVLVGVNDYDDPTYPRLSVCANDAKAVSDLLVSADFDPARVRLLTDSSTDVPGRVCILQSLKTIASATEPDDLLVFYFSGHGDEDNGEYYLVPRDASRSVLGDSAVSIARVKEIVQEAPSRAKVIILDACHSGAQIGGKDATRMPEAFIRRVFEEAEGIAILASCKQGELSWEWPEKQRSVFTHFLLEGLEGQADGDGKGFVTMQDVNRFVVDKVKEWGAQNRRTQSPTFESSVVGDIPLVRYRMLKGS